MKFGDKVTAVHAGPKNPLRHGYFVRRISRRHTNKYGIVHTDRLIQVTDGNGKFADFYADSIAPGWKDGEPAVALNKIAGRL